MIGGPSALAWTGGLSGGWASCLSALAAVKRLDSILVAGRVGGSYSGNVAFQHSTSFAQAVGAAFASGVEQLLVLMAPVLVPAGVLDYGDPWMGEDPRIAAVSFLTTGPGFLSFPSRNAERAQHLARETADSVTRKIRQAGPHPGRVPIAIPEGGAVLISRAAFVAIGGFRCEFDDDPELAIAEFALRAAQRGFFTCLDAHTLMVHPVDVAVAATFATPSQRRTRLQREHPFFPALYDDQRVANDGPLALALDYARASSGGLRVLIDGSCLGPLEMGTQVQTLALITALANHSQVQWVGVGLPASTLPPYAAGLLASPKIRLYPQAGLAFEGAEQADILHSPSQPGQALPVGRWRELARRVVISILDLIAYRIGPYHSDLGSWLFYRHNLAAVLAQADGVVTLSHDVMRTVQEEKFGLPRERLFVVECGTDHMAADAYELIPMALLERGWAAARFALVLGTDYTHKNRDLAIRVWRSLKERGHPLKLIIAGASIPYGSSRDHEALAGNVDDEMLVLPDVSSPERNWLLRHASLLLYPTSAEGFGLVPFEAARLGTPTVSVSFGPLRELGAVETMAASWDVEALAGVAARVLQDPAYARQAVQGLLESGARLTWAASADKLVRAYFQLLCNNRR